MFDYIDSWVDIWRLVVLLVCATCTVVLGVKFWHKQASWNPKTRDYWYSLMAWSVAGCVIAVQGTIQQRPFTAALLFVTLAALVSLNGLRRKGAWGGDG